MNLDAFDKWAEQTPYFDLFILLVMIVFVAIAAVKLFKMFVNWLKRKAEDFWEEL